MTLAGIPYGLVRPLLFALHPETAHALVLRLLALWGRLPGPRLAHTGASSAVGPGPSLAVRLGPLVLPNPVGLAAGFDKDAVALAGLARLGFGFVEVGTVTPRPQPGNPRPRVFRFPRLRAIVNRLGFNSAGAQAVGQNLQRGRPPGLVVGINVGPNRTTPLDEVWRDYADTMTVLYPYADYFTINVSSPNTPGLRGLQEAGRLDSLLERIGARGRERAGELQVEPRPLMLKVSPDLDAEGLATVARIALDRGIGAIVATNTTVRREEAPDLADLEGGLSGAPLGPRALEVLTGLRAITGGALGLVGVGGIMTAEDAWARLAAGAGAIQVYTGLVYSGPGLVRRILDEIERRLVRAGVDRLEALVRTAGAG